MSWSVEFTGRAGTVNELVKKRLADVRCTEPEETIKSLVGLQIAASLGAMDPKTPVSVKASGSQGDYEKYKTNQLRVEIQPFHTWVE